MGKGLSCGRPSGVGTLFVEEPFSGNHEVAKRCYFPLKGYLEPIGPMKVRFFVWEACWGKVLRINCRGDVVQSCGKKEVEDHRQQLAAAKRHAESIAVITPVLEKAFLEVV
ncbi:hypothetical protein CK203_080690 [Vitis vinifera]|uniref:Reverse transcriptase zinc-binding domain-containing protein n=1 Tax=Vitis vinifera TaxID=29760 RepID=A0A438DZ75_VITVI|nr:hypothetical protein CK203_080690 [Vitis vinifera]